MLAWLWRALGGDATKKTKRAPARDARVTSAEHGGGQGVLDGRGQVANDVGKPGADTPPKAGTAPARKKERYFEQLVREAGEPIALTPEQEQRTSVLVDGAMRYLQYTAIEPPVMPALASRMLELLRADEVDVVALSRLIEQDQATAAKLLTIANSAVFRGASEVATVRDAVVFLGTQEVARIAIGLTARSMFDGKQQSARWRRLFHHAMTTAFSACQIATQRTRRHADAAFLGGLFHDVGKAVALRALVEGAALDEGSGADDPAIDAALYQMHAEASLSLYDSWKLPKQLMAICRTHHHLTADAPPELHYVRLVSGLDVLQYGSAREKHEALPEIDESAGFLKLTDAELRVAHTETRQYAEKVAQMFG